VVPLAHVNSRLFGGALTGLPFAVYGVWPLPPASPLASAEAAPSVPLGTDHLIAPIDALLD
jgi:hypothetical protein